MWTDPDGNFVPETEQYRSPNGTLYPADFPKAEIPGLVWNDPPMAPEPVA